MGHHGGLGDHCLRRSACGGHDKERRGYHGGSGSRLALRNGRGGGCKQSRRQQRLWEHPEEIFLVEIPELAVLEAGTLRECERKIHMLTVKYHV